MSPSRRGRFAIDAASVTRPSPSNRTHSGIDRGGRRRPRRRPATRVPTARAHASRTLRVHPEQSSSNGGVRRARRRGGAGTPGPDEASSGPLRTTPTVLASGMRCVARPARARVAWAGAVAGPPPMQTYWLGPSRLARRFCRWIWSRDRSRLTRGCASQRRCRRRALARGPVSRASGTRGGHGAAPPAPLSTRPEAVPVKKQDPSRSSTRSITRPSHNPIHPSEHPTT